MTAEQIAVFVAEMEHRFRERTPARSELYASVADRVGRSEMKEGRDPMTASVPERLLAALIQAIDKEERDRGEGQFVLTPSWRCLDCTSGTAPSPTQRCAYHEATRWLERMSTFRKAVARATTQEVR